MTERTITEYSVRLVRDREFCYQGTKLCGPGDAARILHAILDDSPVERIVVLYLSGANQIQGYEIVSQGGLDGSAIRPSEIFRGALLHCAHGIVIGHNHPSGDPTPSSHDIRFTDAVKKAGQLLGVELLDHVIVAPGRTCSLSESGLIQESADNLLAQVAS